MKLIKVFFLIVFILCCELTSAQQRFKIENGSFLIVGKRTQLICGIRVFLTNIGETV